MTLVIGHVTKNRRNESLLPFTRLQKVIIQTWVYECVHVCTCVQVGGWGEWGVCGGVCGVGGGGL